jgi:CDP-diacylglycerol--serine O-phosphatidyltransferase
MSLKRHIPSFLTSLNLVCGCLAVAFVSRNRLEWAAYAVLAAAVFDLLDGLLARALGAFSEFGKQLDSLADMVSFGLVPGFILFRIFQMPFNHLLDGPGMSTVLLMYLPFLVTVFSALRLAKFNIDVRQKDAFIGLPSPANAILTASYALIIGSGSEPFLSWLLHPWVLLLLIALQSYLLVAEIPMFAFKMSHFGWKGNQIRYVFLLVSIVLVAVFFYAAIPVIIFFYVLLSLATRKTASP